MGHLDLEPSAVYRSLGLRRVINAADTYTDLGGARLPDEVAEAMIQGGAHQVDIRELLAASGARIAELTNNPAALVVNGAAAAITVSVAAAMASHAARKNRERGRRPEVIVLCCQRNPYDSAIAAAGASIVQVGYADSTPLEGLRAAVTADTVAIVWFAGTQFEKYSPALEVMARIAREAEIPLIVDAAAQFPPLSNLWTYRERGADLVIFSGGKGLKGPQSSGLILGSAELVARCAENSYPNHSVGRTMKTSKENIVGLVAAVERATKLDWDALYAGWESGLAESAARFAGLAGLTTRIDPRGRLGQYCPRLFLEWDEDAFGLSAQQLADTLATRSPSIRIGSGEGGPRSAYLNPYSLLPGEREFVTDALVSVFVASEEQHG